MTNLYYVLLNLTKEQAQNNLNEHLTIKLNHLSHKLKCLKTDNIQPLKAQQQL